MTARWITGTACTTCKRTMRASTTPVADAPGTMGHGAKGLCVTCYSHSRGRGGTRIDEVKRRQDVSAITHPVNVTPETMATATAKVKRWFPGDRQLLDMLGMTS